MTHRTCVLTGSVSVAVAAPAPRLPALLMPSHVAVSNSAHPDSTWSLAKQIRFRLWALKVSSTRQLNSL